MRISRGLLAFVRASDEDVSERRVVAAATSALIRQRRRTFPWAAPLLALLPATPSSKLSLWCQLAQATTNTTLPQQRWSLVQPSLKATQAYQNARARLSRGSSGLWLRGPAYRELLTRWCELAPERLMFFHHYDSRGLLPRSWLEVLKAVQLGGWQVVVSSSGLHGSAIKALQAAGVQVALRSNTGLCLGAYRDLSLALLSHPQAWCRLQSVVLCNDSTLPLQSPENVLRQLQDWCVHAECRAVPLLVGLTDSAERNQYHLQSYCLVANRALLQHPTWLRFWLDFSVDGSKDDLINRGEIGLSQALLAAGIELQALYSLVQGLLGDPAMAKELQRYGVREPCQANQSLFAWQSLLARGFPLVKKRILFECADLQTLYFALPELMQWVPSAQQDLLLDDLHQLFISRYSNQTGNIA